MNGKSPVENARHRPAARGSQWYALIRVRLPGSVGLARSRLDDNTYDDAPIEVINVTKREP